MFGEAMNRVRGGRANFSVVDPDVASLVLAGRYFVFLFFFSL